MAKDKDAAPEIPTPNTTHTTLAGAMLAAQRAIEGIARDSTSGGKDARFSFKYVSADEMTTHCRAALLANGLVYSMGSCTEDREARSSHQVWNRDANCAIDMPIWVMRCEHTLTHAASGESVRWTTTFPAVSSNGRPIDKATAGAMTVASREALRYILCVPRVDENEIEKRNDDDYGSRPAASSRPAPQPSPPKHAAPSAAPSGKAATVEWEADKWPPDGVHEVVGTVGKIAVKMGTSKTGKAWTRYGINVLPSDGGEELWLNTFSETGHDAAQALGKAPGRFAFADNGKGLDLLGVWPVGAAAAIADDSLPF